MKKFVIFVLAVIFTNDINFVAAQENSFKKDYFLETKQQIDEVLKNCVKDTDKTIMDPEMREVLISEINCKKNVIIEELNRIMPDKEKDNAIKALNNYERSYIELYNIITNKNNTCENIFKCGTIGENMPYELFNQELNKLLEYTFERKNGTF